MHHHLRIARPVSDLARSARMYCQGLGLQELGQFKDHAGFDGAMLGTPDMQYHFEFTHCPAHSVAPAPTVEDLVVFYIPNAGEWQAACARMLTAGFNAAPSFNPYWSAHGRTFVDLDGYRVVLQNSEWKNQPLQ